jgi:phage terminase small subunit
MAGRPKKPLKLKLLEGDYREDRHGQPSQAMATATGAPRMPGGLDDVGRELWEHVVSQQKNYLSESDATALAALCQLWSLRSRTLAMANRRPVDKDIRCSFLGYHNAAEKLLAKFGMTPSDRAKLGEVSPQDFDPAAEFIA